MTTFSTTLLKQEVQQQHTQFKPIATVWYVGQGSLWEEGERCEKEDSLDGGMEEGENPQNCWRRCLGTKNEKMDM